MGPAEKRRYPGEVKAPGDKKEDVFYFFVYLYRVHSLVVQGGNVANATFFSLFKLPNCGLFVIFMP